MKKRLKDARGFTLIETMVALALIAAVMTLGLRIAVMGMHGLAAVRQGGSTSGRQPLARFADQLRADARSAFAVDLPAGASAPSASQILFYAVDDRGRRDYWGYTSVGNQVVRNDYGPTPGAPTAASVVADITGLSVRRITADRLRDAAANPGYAAALAPLATATCYDVPTVHVLNSPCGATFAGGNHVIVATITDPEGSAEVHLVAGTLPSNFTIRAAPTAHVVVYRVDHVHRTWLGAAQKTFADVLGSVSLSWNNGPYVSWCDAIPIYLRIGSGPQGLFQGGPGAHASYDPADVQEKASTLVARCAQSSLPPQANATGAVLLPPPPDTFDTPPPGAAVPAGYTPPPGVYASVPYCRLVGARSPLCTAGGLPLHTPPPQAPLAAPPPHSIFPVMTPGPLPLSGGNGGGG